MDAMRLAVRLVVDGYVMIPNAVDQARVQAARDAFERQATATGKRNLGWKDIHRLPEMMAVMCPPGLMAVVERFMRLVGDRAVWANSSGIRDAYNPDAVQREFDRSDLARAPLGWHEDVAGMTNPRLSFLRTALNTLLYLDQTWPDNGAYCAAVGSHHLCHGDAEDRPVMPSAELVLEHCELVPVPVQPGAIIVHRASHWHGVMPPKQTRRLLLQTFCGDSVYDMQAGHTQIDDDAMALIPADRHGHFRTYATA